MWYLYGVLITLPLYYMTIALLDRVEEEVPINGFLTYVFWPVGVPVFIVKLLLETKRA